MGRISEDDIRKVREATDVVELVSERTPVKQKGREFWACCPLHQEKTPSFKIDPAEQRWYCFGCHEHGNAIDLVMKLDDLSFPDAVRKLAERAHIEIQETAGDAGSASRRRRLKDVCAETADFYSLQLMRGRGEGSAKAREYLSGRGLGGDVPREWRLGYAPGRGALVRHLSQKGFTDEEMVDANVAAPGKNGMLRDRFFDRVMFPIADASGDVIAFGGRIMQGDGPKYLNSQETPIFHKSDVLYGLDKAKASMTATGTAIVTEGYTDVIAMHKAGLENTVAALGTALTKSHVRTLARHAGRRIVYIFDGDVAGQRATDRALQFIDESVTPESGRSRLDIRALTLPEGMDPAEFLDTHPPERMKELVEGSKPLIQFGIERRISMHDTGTPEGRAAALVDALSVISPIKGSILAKDYARQIAGMLHFREDDVLEQLSRTKAPRRYDDSRPEAASAAPRNPARPARAASRLSVAERSRLSTERELLSLCAQHPVEAIAIADSLEGVRWHDSVHLELASSLLSTLMEKLDSTPAEIFEKAQAVTPMAEKVLSSASLGEETSAPDMLRYLSDELAIGDMEEEVMKLKEQAARTGSAEDFQRLVEEQNRLNDAKNSHKPLR